MAGHRELPLSVRAARVTAGRPDLPLTVMVRGIIAPIPAGGVVDLHRAVPDIIEAAVVRRITATTVGLDLIAVSVFLPTVDPGGAATAKEGPYGPGEKRRECSTIIM